jgi:histone H3/H4
MLSEEDDENEDATDMSNPLGIDGIDHDEMLQYHTPSNLTQHLQKHSKQKRKSVQLVSKHGIHFPSFPARVIKKMAVQDGVKLTRDTLQVLDEATADFFRQVSEDAAMYAEHAGRKRIDDVDMIQLLRRCAYLTPIHNTCPNISFNIQYRLTYPLIFTGSDR